MATYPTKLAEQFAAKVLQIFYSSTITEVLTNQDFQGQIENKASILNILTLNEVGTHTYNGSDMVADSLGESNAQLKTDQAQYIYFTVKDYDTFRSYIKDPESTVFDQSGKKLKQVIDAFVLGFYGKVAAGHRIGTDYATGTVTVTVTTGAVVGSGTTFTAAMVGRGFKAAGHTQWYRVATYTDATHITIEDDLDDVASQYTGGAIGAGAIYTVEAATPIQVTKSNIYHLFNQLAEKLDNDEIPEDDRVAIVPPEVATLIKESPEFIPSGSETARSEVVQRGSINGQFAGFNIYKASKKRIGGDSVNGWHIIAANKNWLTFAMGLTRNGTEDAIANFGKRFKSLYVYGAKVADERRKCAAELFASL